MSVEEKVLNTNIDKDGNIFVNEDMLNELYNLFAKIDSSDDFKLLLQDLCARLPYGV